MALTDLNLVQNARQTAFGTAVAAATAKLQGVSSLRLVPELQARIINHVRGSLAPGFETVLDGHKGAATAESEAESYEDINYWLDSMFSAATPTGAGPYVRAYAAPLTAAATPKFNTLQWGQTGAVYRLEDASVSTLTLSGSSNGTVQSGVSIMGSKVGAGAIAALSDRTGLTTMLGNHALLYIDAWAGTIGTTAIATSAFAWELSVNANREYRTYLGNLTPGAWNDKKWTGQLKLSVELDATTGAYLTDILAATNAILQKQIRIKYTVGSAGTLRTFSFDFAGQTLSAPELWTDRQGVVAFDLTLDGVYNPTMANWIKFDTTCNTATMV